MTYQVEYATEADALGLGRVNNDSFQDRLMLSAMFPETDQPTLRTYKSFHIMKHLTAPETHVLKITDPTTGTIIGYGRWVIPTVLGIPPNVPELSEEAQIYAKDPVAFAPQPFKPEVYQGFRAVLQEGQKKHTTDRDIHLDLLATLPGYQGRGVGSAILRWGINQADAVQARIYLESTPEGYPVYLKYGFKALEEITLDYEKMGGHGKEDLVLMIRDPVSLQ
ncbi:hypothetical protein N7466_008020 [Penicillium verhagenii]|uniref:uncharacterized protein n=1 Tax=Penicillium verhagenii TaxID=1562060 RepID=UPI00254534B9|nr:uncharacterized protein N7466_008020 [Penicillium verhagenii]KAJ5923833.1 hypothetical protein N7466_008020 [Penicillium verhagenii]